MLRFCWVVRTPVAPVKPWLLSREPFTVNLDNADSEYAQVAPNTRERMLELTEKLSSTPAATPSACSSRVLHVSVKVLLIPSIAKDP